MANILLDDVLILVPTGTLLTASTTYPARAAAVTQAGPIAWVIAISSVNNGPVYTFTLEWSDLAAGTFTPLAAFALPTVTAPTNFSVGVGGWMTRSRVARWVRLVVDIGGGGRAITFGSGLTLLRTGQGLAMRAAEVVTVT